MGINFSKLRKLHDIKLDDISKGIDIGIGFNVDLTLNYRLATDSFLYTTSYPYSAGTALDVSSEWNNDGVGYVILSYGAIS